jgi:glycosyltransferase involved in cell wall biosynthesis
VKNKITPKILIVHNYYQIPGGEDTVIANEKKLLEDNGHEVIQYSRNNNEIKDFSLIKWALFPFTSIFSVKTYRDVKRIIRSNDIDIVHVHNTLSLISPSVYYAAIKCNVPVVQTIHNFRLLCPGATFYRDGHICEDCVSFGLYCAVKHKCYRNSRLQTLAYVISSKIHRTLSIYGKLNYICLTKFNQEKILQLKGLNPEQVFIKPNFVVDVPDKVITYEQRKNQYVFAGRIDKLKGIDTLLQAWKGLGVNAPKLVVCGTGPMEEWCQKYIANNDLKNVEMKGFLTNVEVRKEIADSKALILPTQCYEGFPMTIVESYASGTPVIGSNIGNVDKLIEEEITGVKFPYSSPEGLVNVLRKFEKLDHNTLCKNCYQVYNENYSSIINYNKIIDIYSKALDQDMAGYKWK